MSERIVKADTKAIDELGDGLMKAKRQLLGKLIERGYKILAGQQIGDTTSGEVPYETGNLIRSIQTHVDYDQMVGEIVVTGHKGFTSGGAAEVFNAKGEKRKVVTLRPQPAYNYAEVVARGNTQPTLSPTRAKAFLIPVPSRPTGEGFLMIGGKYFVVRRTRKGQKANPFDERTAVKLESEIPAISDSVLSQFV